VLRGDIDLDGHITGTDISALLNTLCDLSAYQSAHFPTSPDLMRDVVDVNGDGAIDNLDLQALIMLEINGIAGASDAPAAVPEPSGVILSAFCLLGLIVLGRARPILKHLCRARSGFDLARQRNQRSQLL
jgi:hypothetical protein